MIYVTVGTMYLDFPRLIHKVDALAENTEEKVLMQIGLGKTFPKHCEYFDFKPREDVLAIQKEARVIVCHAGIGSVMDALTAARPLIVVPRLRKLKEHLNDHQMDLAQAIERRGWGRMILDIDDLGDALANPPEAKADYRPSAHRMVATVRDKIERVAAMKADR